MSPKRPRIALPVPHSSKPDYNARSLPQYIQALEQSGAEPVVVPLDAPPSEVARMATQCTGVLLPGSPADVDPQKYGNPRIDEVAPADPLREMVDELLLQDAFNLHKPILGICYGLQSLNVWLGGTLVQHLRSGVNHQAGSSVLAAHDVELDPGCRLAELDDGPLDASDPPSSRAVSVNSSHHQAVLETGDGLRIAARSTEDGVIEAVEFASHDRFVVGVQWHPERIMDAPLSRALFTAFVREARLWHLPDL